MTGRLRVSRVVLQLEAFADDGDNLMPLQVQPVTVNRADWAGFDLAKIEADLQRQLGDQEPKE